MIGVQAFLVAIQFGWIPPLAHFWGFNLWQYLPFWVQVGLCSGVLLICWPPASKKIAYWLRTVARWTPNGHPLMVLGAIQLTVTLLFWFLRERIPVADSLILLFSAQSGSAFLLPEMGATYLAFFAAVKVGPLIQLSPAESIQLLVCLFGGLAVVAIIRVARFLAPDRESRAFVVSFLLCSGMLRIFAGHIEVYAMVLCGGIIYLWAACSYLREKCDFRLPCVVLGIDLWLHLAFICLVPSLLLLPNLKTQAPQLKLARRVIDLLWVALPTALFLLAMHVAGQDHSLKAAWLTCERILNLRPDPMLPNRWVGFGLDDGSLTATYTLFSASQFKYLVNAFFILAPWSLPVLVFLAVLSPKRLIETKEARFLSIVCLPLLLYAFALRPIWGPYDWDLFSLTALYVSFLAAHIWIAGMPERPVPDFVVFWLVAGLLFIAIPFLWMGVSVSYPAGPFAPQAFDWSLFEPGTPKYRSFSHWF